MPAKKRDNILEYLKTVYCRQKPAYGLGGSLQKVEVTPHFHQTRYETDVYIEDILIPASQAMKKQ